MKSVNYCLLFLLSTLYIISNPSAAYSQDDFEFQVLSTKTVMQIDGVNQDVTWENAENAKGMIVSVKANIPADMELWGPDFNITYKHEDGKEDRGNCRGLTTPVSSSTERPRAARRFSFRRPFQRR